MAEYTSRDQRYRQQAGTAYPEGGGSASTTITLEGRGMGIPPGRGFFQVEDHG